MTHETVNFVNENGAGLIESRKFEKDTNKLLTFTSPFWHHWWRRNVEECCLTLCGNRFSQHGLELYKRTYLSCAWWSKKENTSPGLKDPRKVVWVFERQHYGLLDESLGIVESNDVSELDIRVLDQNISLKVRCKLSILWNIRIVRNAFQHSNVKSLFVFLVVILLQIFWRKLYDNKKLTTAFPVISIDYYRGVYFLPSLIESFFLKLASIIRINTFRWGNRRSLRGSLASLWFLFLYWGVHLLLLESSSS